MNNRLVASAIATVGVVLLLSPPAQAQPRPVAQSPSVAQSVAGWTGVGAGAGFGLGVYFGLRAFDDAVNSDRKVWTSAIAGSAIGGVAGYFVGRLRQGSRPPGSPSIRPGLEQHSRNDDLVFANPFSPGGRIVLSEGDGSNHKHVVELLR